MFSHLASGVPVRCFSLTFLGWGVWLTQLARASEPLPLSPERAVALALSNSPDVRDIEAECQRSQAAQARLRAPLYNPSGTVQSTPDGQRYGLSLSQPLVLSPQRRALRAQAIADLEAAEALLHRARLTTAAETRRAYSAASARIAVTVLVEQNLSYMEQLERAASLRHKEGEAALLDVRLARLSRAQATSWLLEAREAETDSLQALSALIGEPITADAIVADPLSAAPPPDNQAPQQRSDVRAAAAALRSAEARFTATRAAAVPPLSVGAFVEQEDGELFIGPAVSWTLPTFERNQEDRAMTAASQRTAQAQLLVRGAQAETELTTNAARLAEADRLTESLGDDLAEEAEAALASIQLGYQSGQNDLLTTVLFQTQVIEGQASLIELSEQVADARLAWMLAAEDSTLLRETP